MRRPLRRPSSPVFVRAAHQRPSPGAPLRVRPRRIRPPSRPPVADPAPPRPWSAPRRPWSAQIRPSQIHRRSVRRSPSRLASSTPGRRSSSPHPPPSSRLSPSAAPDLQVADPAAPPFAARRVAVHLPFATAIRPSAEQWQLRRRPPIAASSVHRPSACKGGLISVCGWCPSTIAAVIFHAASACL